MSLIDDLTTVNLRENGIAGLAHTMPVISRRWCTAATADISSALTVDATSHRLGAQSGTTFRAPLPALVKKVDASHAIDVSLFRPDGSVVSEPGLLCELFPQAYLRLARLAARHFEQASAHNPLRAAGTPLHPVPRYFYVRPTSLPTSARGGMVRAGEDIEIGGELDFFDAGGNWIHPLFVASMLARLVTQYSILDRDAGDPDQLASIVALQSDARRVRLVTPGGAPYTGGHFSGITTLDAGLGYFSVDTPSGSDPSVVGQVSRESDTGATGAFPAEKARRLLIQHAAYGRMGASVTLPAAPSATAPSHDFYTLIVTELDRALLGERPVAFDGVKLEPAPVVRVHENLRLLATGNQVMAGLGQVFTGTPADSLAAAMRLDTHFALPADFNSTDWPAFPAAGTGTPDDAEFPDNLRTEITSSSTATFITPTSSPATDVLSGLKALPRGAAVRAYNRTFLPDAVLARGNGAGTVVSGDDGALTTTFHGTTDLALRDPLGIVHPDGTATVPSEPHLIVDLMIVQRSGRKRLLGSLEWNVAAAAPATLTPPAANAVDGAARKGVCNAGILGNTAPPLSSLGSIATASDLANLALQLTGETQPRDASRLPTMARRELVAAARTGTSWRAVLSGGGIEPAMHCAQSAIGAPGSQGGKETSLTGVYTEQNRLAYDLARSAFRRTAYIADRMVALADASWQEPAETTPLGESEAPTGGRGTMHGAVLHTIAPFCETPELALLKSLVASNLSSIPADFNALVDLVVGWINGLSTSGLPSPLATGAARLRTEVVNQLNGLKDNDPATESQRERLYNELLRELAAACFGRRDAQWALREGIRQARHFIYLETPGFSFTQRGAAQPYSVDLIAELQSRMNAVPGLKVILCVPRKPDYHPPGYDQWIRREVEQRFTLIQGLPGRQLVAFHPIGFPGRPASVETTTMIVDDRWALVGASAFRRRGLTFDSSSDMVFIDGEQRDAAAPTLTALRVALLRQRLGLEQAEAGASALTQLADARVAFRLVRETLVAGGLGRIERLWNGREEGVVFADPTIDNDLANPEGLAFNALAATVYSLFTTTAR